MKDKWKGGFFLKRFFFFNLTQKLFFLVLGAVNTHCLTFRFLGDDD